MTGLLLGYVFWALGASVDVSIAPDQPLPQVYVDDQVIGEFVADGDISCEVMTEFRNLVSGEVRTVSGESLVLRKDVSYWKTYDSVVLERGYYVGTVTLMCGDEQESHALRFCRVDRPVDRSPVPLSISRGPDWGHEALAMRGIPVERVCLGGEEIQADPGLVSAVAGGGRHVVVTLGSSFADPSGVGTVVDLAADAIRWQLEPQATVPVTVELARALRTQGVNAPITVVITGREDLDKLLRAGCGRYVTGMTLRGLDFSESNVAGIRASAEKLGYERISLGYESAATAGGDACGLVRDSIDALISGGEEVHVDPRVIVDGGVLQPAYPYMVAMAHRLGSAVYIGRIEAGQDDRVEVFRTGGDWTVVYWTRGTPHRVELATGDAAGLTGYDSFNNALEPEVTQEGRVALWMDEGPRYLSGHGGTVIMAAARGAARREAAALVAAGELAEAFTPEIVDVVREYIKQAPEDYDRLDFLTLLRMFPNIENRWHDGELSRSVAVPAMAGLARLLRAICTVEQEAGHVFIDPLEDTLTKCREYQSLYVTGSSGEAAGRERGDWLLGEVGRLVAESEELARVDRGIEANGVAALAEWRARSLETAAQAVPLSIMAPESE